MVAVTAQEEKEESPERHAGAVNTLLKAAKTPKQSCINCHFLTRSSQVEGQEREHVTHLSDSELQAARNGDYSWRKAYYSLRCQQAVWSEGYRFDETRLHELLVETDRTDFCFFWTYRPGMLFSAARVLQEREAAYRQSARDRRLTIIGLWIAALALVFSLILKILEKVT